MAYDEQLAMRTKSGFSVITYSLLMNLIYIVLKNNNKATVQGVAKCSNR
jgi:hypothetical protein